MSDKDFDIPRFGPADEERAKTANHNEKPMASSTHVSSQSTAPSKGGFLTGFFVFVLFILLAGMGYVTYNMFLQLQTSQASVAKLEQQMASLQALLDAAESTAQESGSTMLERLAAATTR
ncbi:MAG: hypothetical protein ACPGPF_10500, partial [Pontibacterium sp.]